MLGPFAGALLDRWDRRLVLVAANLGRLLLVLGVAALLAAGAGDLPVLLRRVDRQRFHPVRLVGSVGGAAGRGAPRAGGHDERGGHRHRAAGAFLGANFMLLPRWVFGSDDTGGAAAIIFIVTLPVALAFLLSVRVPPTSSACTKASGDPRLGRPYAVATGWLHGARTVLAVPTVAATLSGLAAHRIVVRHQHAARVGDGAALRHPRPSRVGHHGVVRRRYRARRVSCDRTDTQPRPSVGPIRGAQRRTGVRGGRPAVLSPGLQLPVMVLCGFFLGAAGQVVKLCADTAMQIDVDDALRRARAPRPGRAAGCRSSSRSRWRRR